HHRSHRPPTGLPPRRWDAAGGGAGFRGGACCGVRFDFQGSGSMRWQHLWSVGLAVLLAGCGREVVGPRSDELARLRLASASPDAGALDLVVNGMTVARAVESTAASTP